MTKQKSKTLQTERIRLLNDALRQGGSGGQIMTTAGVDALGREFIARAMTAIARFDAFDSENDPCHEHDFRALCSEGQHLFFKIGYFDHTMTMGSPDPADPTVTCRVMTVMLKNEY